MAYQTLDKLFYRDASSARFSRLETRARERLEAESSYRTGIILEHGELFLAVPRELSLVNEQVLRAERRVSALWKALPPVALRAYIRSLIMDEVVSSNEIEGVRSTRKQIRDALDSMAGASTPRQPFVEFARLYLGLTEADAHVPTTLQEIRAIYDAVVGDTLAEADQLGSSLFRTDDVEIYGTGGRLIHVGVPPERIRPLLRAMLDVAHDPALPGVYAAALCHFLFEYIHPFYDGNGRTGRYLLALQLSEVLSLPTALSLSRAISEHKARYYRAFNLVEHPLNHEEATPFALMLCELLQQAQQVLIDDLEAKRTQIDQARDAIQLHEAARSDRERRVLFFAAQRYLFDELQDVSTTEVANDLGVSATVARSVLKRLAAAGLLVQTGKRPLAYVLSEDAARRFGLAYAG